MTEKLTNIDSPFMLMVGDGFVGIDGTSGGYPYKTGFHNAGRFKTADDAVKYIGRGIKQYLNNVEPQLVEITAIEYKFHSINDIIDEEYEKELAELKKKYGK